MPLGINITNVIFDTSYVFYGIITFNDGIGNTYTLNIGETPLTPGVYYGYIQPFDSTTGFAKDVTLTIDQRDEIVKLIMQLDYTTIYITGSTVTTFFASNPTIRYFEFSNVILDLDSSSNSKTLSDTIFWDESISSSNIKRNGLSGRKFNAIKIRPSITIAEETDIDMDWGFYFDAQKKIMVKMIVHAGKQSVIKNNISSAFTLAGLPQSEVDPFYNSLVSGVEVTIDTSNNNFLKLHNPYLLVPNNLQSYLSNLIPTNNRNLRFFKTDTFLYLYNNASSYSSDDTTFVFCPSSSNNPTVQNVYFQKTATGTTQTLTAADYTIHNNVIKLVPGTTVGSAPINFALLKVEWEGFTQAGMQTFNTILTNSSNNVELNISINLPPTSISLDSLGFDENIAVNTKVATISGVDPNGNNNSLTFSLVNSGDHAKFTISGTDLKISESPDYETKSSYTITIRATDVGGLTYDETFTLTVNNLNEAPTSISLDSTSFNENIAANTKVATISGVDPEGDQLTFSLVNSGDHAKFTISGTDLKISESPDYETKPSYAITIRATDTNGLTFDKTFTLTVNNLNEATTGNVTIDGTLQVGKELTANTNNLADLDGLNNVSYNYQWSHVNGAVVTPINGATNKKYTLVRADGGKNIRVTVTFSDDSNNNITKIATSNKVPAISNTFGDPHINTLDGKLFELPKEKGIYRLIQGNNLILNASTRKINSDEIEQISILEKKYKTELIKDGCYYDNLYIKSDNNILICNLDTQSIRYSKEYFSINNKKINFHNSTYGEINISLKDCNNVMMKNSFNISIENTNNLSGLMASEYLIDTMKVNKLTDSTLKEGIKGKNPVFSKLVIPKK